MTRSTEITNDADVLDSRDVIARIEHLESERDDAPEGTDWTTEYPEEAAELAALTALAEEASGYAADWTYGETLIRDSYFHDYAQELADDIGAIPKDVTWPLTCINWEQAARDLQYDYTAVDFDGVTYWIR